jgi:hypothetical protein
MVRCLQPKAAFSTGLARHQIKKQVDLLFNSQGLMPLHLP